MSAMRTRKVFNRVASLMLAVVMMVGIFSAVSPQQAEAATRAKSFKSTGKSAVVIKDSECLNKNGQKNVHWIKFKAGVTGYVTISISVKSSKKRASVGVITLCNKSKKTIGHKNEAWQTNFPYKYGYERTYGVKKGQTYYFKVSCSAGTKLKATVKPVKKSTANSRKWAKNIGKKKTVTGVIIAGEKKADWYKIKLTKKQILKITSATLTNGDDEYAGLKVSFYDSKGKLFFNYGPGKQSVNFLSPLSPRDNAQYCLRNRYGYTFGINPGTYYVKVEGYNKYSSGYYTLKWQ